MVHPFNENLLELQLHLQINYSVISIPLNIAPCAATQIMARKQVDTREWTVNARPWNFPTQIFLSSVIRVNSGQDKRGAKCDKKGISFTLEWDKMDLMSKVFVLFSTLSWGKEESFSVIVHHTCWRSSPRFLVSLVVWCCWGFSALNSNREK